MANENNKAAWLMSKQAHPFVIADAPMPRPSAQQVTVRVRAVAINPVDMAMQAYGVIREVFPSILGVDTAGEVTAIGEEVTSFAVGDRVIGMCGDHDMGDIGKNAQGSYQLFCNLPVDQACKLPENVDFKDGCVLPLCMCTAAVGLFEDYNLGLALPGTDAEVEAHGKTVLIWGGASSVGSCAIQAVKLAGYEVAATAGPHNLEYLKSIGADHAFDYKSDRVVEDVINALQSKEFAGAFDAVMGEETYIKCAEIVTSLGGRQMVATVLPPAMKYEKALPGRVQMGYNWGSSLNQTALGPALWDWMPKALANGSLRCKPDAYVVGRGLEKVQEACDLMKTQGASAQKYVVELP